MHPADTEIKLHNDLARLEVHGMHPAGLGKYDCGTFEDHRNETCKLLAKGTLKYTLSGHSHRSGLYQVIDGDKDWVRSSMTVKGRACETKPTTRHHPFDTSGLTGSRVLVAACGGPISAQNHANEMFNWGLDYPSGNVIKFDGSSDKQIAIKTPGLKQAQPRLAVALDYADIFLREKEESSVFSQFASEKNKDPLTIELNEKLKLPDIAILDSIILTFYLKDGTVITLQGSVVRDHDEGRYRFQPDDQGFYALFDDAADEQQMGFISLKLKPIPFKAFRQYNTDSRWVYPIQLLSKRKLALEALEETIKYHNQMSNIPYPESSAEPQRADIKKYVQGYFVQRHDTWGEVPDLKWYKKKFPNEYA